MAVRDQMYEQDIKELNIEIDALKAENAKLKAENGALLGITQESLKRGVVMPDDLYAKLLDILRTPKQRSLELEGSK